MEAEDTALKGLGLLEAIKYEDGEVGVSKFERLAKAQAEISFKAGIREVVEWVSQFYDKDGYSLEERLVMRWSEWQAKLKEWGIK